MHMERVILMPGSCVVRLKVHQGPQVGAPVGVPGGEFRARPAEDRQRDERRLDVAPQRRRVRHRPRRGLARELGRRKTEPSNNHRTSHR
jgi:hypothetical protein